ncbi:MAG: VWA domain-containing protein [Planctomycetota bacterium]
MRNRFRLVGALTAFAALAALVAPMALAKLDSKEWKAAENALKRAAAANDTAGMIDAISKVAEDGTKRAVDLLVGVGVNLEDARVYDAVRDGLQSMDEPEAIAHMLKILKKKSTSQWTLRVVLLEGLIPHEGEEITVAMADKLDDKVPYVISAAAKALGKRKDPKAVAQLIDALEELEKNKDVPWIDTKQALTDITGEDYADSQAWRDYWQVVGDTFDPNKDRGEKDTSTTVVRDDEASQFFKEKIIAKRIMFVIDVSGSMEAEDPPIEGQGGGKRIERVKNELIRTIKGLKGDVTFNVMAYSHVLKSWKKIDKGAPLHKASKGNKADAIKWVTSLKADGATQTDDALEKSFELISVNTIVLLSDGAPSRLDKQSNSIVEIPAQEILDKVKGMNRLRGVKIHTFCFEVFKQSPGAEPLLEFMRKMAEENGGKMSLIR